jgi:hypothetical protein
LQALDRAIEIVGVEKIRSMLDHAANERGAAQSVVTEALPSPSFP